MSRKAKPMVTVGRIGIGDDMRRTLSQWTVIPILVDGKEIIALSRADAARFANALAHEASRVSAKQVGEGSLLDWAVVMIKARIDSDSVWCLPCSLAGRPHVPPVSVYTVTHASFDVAVCRTCLAHAIETNIDALVSIRPAEQPQHVQFLKDLLQPGDLPRGSDEDAHVSEENQNARPENDRSRRREDPAAES
jgi:hypothetical protein